MSQAQAAAATVPDRPVFANSGVNLDNVAAILAVADGCVVGTHFKLGGDTRQPVDRARARVEELR